MKLLKKLCTRKLFSWCKLFWLLFFVVAIFGLHKIFATQKSTTEDLIQGTTLKENALVFTITSTPPATPENKSALYIDDPDGVGGDGPRVFYAYGNAQEKVRLSINEDILGAIPEVVADNEFYGTMGVENQTEKIDVKTMGDWYPVMGLVAGALDTFEKQILIASDAGGGFVLVLSDEHGLCDGKSITITDTTDYNGTYIISSVAENSFNIIATFVSSQFGVLETSTWVFGASKRNVSITSISDAGGGQVTITSAGHGLKNGEIAFITETMNYGGVYKVSNVALNTFEVTATFMGTESGKFNAPSYLECNDGVEASVRYKISAVLSVKPDDANHCLEFAIFVDNVRVILTLQRNGTWSGDLTILPLQGDSNVDCLTKQKVSIGVRNVTGNKNILIGNANISVRNVY